MKMKTHAKLRSWIGRRLLPFVLLGSFAGAGVSQAQTYSENFDNGTAPGWSVISDTWALSGGTYNKTGTNLGFSIYNGATWGTTPAAGYSFKVRLRSSGGSSGNIAGVVYNVIDANNNYEVSLNNIGTISIRSRVNNAVTTIASESYASFGLATGGATRDLEVIRTGEGANVRTTVKLNGVVILGSIPNQTQLSEGGKIGLMSQFSTVTFDSVSVSPTTEVPPPAGPKIGVSASGTPVVNGDLTPSSAEQTDFGPADVGTVALTRMYTVQNVGDAEVTLGAVAISGPNAADFTVTAQPAPVLAPGKSTTFSVRFATTALGLRSVTLGFGTNDPTKNPFIFALQGTGVAAVPVVHGRYKETFPKLAAYMIGSPQGYDNAAYQAQVARYDLLITSFYKGWVKNGKSPRQAVREIKALNPNILIANYTLLESQSSDSNNTAARDIYDKLFAEKGPNGVGDWWARTPGGALVSIFSGKNSANITEYVTPDNNGDRFPQWYAKREQAVMFDPIPEFDAWFADDVFYKPRTVKPDWNGDGVGDDPENPANWPYFRQGIADNLAAVKALMPQLKTIGNVDGHASLDQGFLRDPEYQGMLDGALLEHAIGRPFSPEVYAGWGGMMTSYRSLMAHTNAPHMVIFQYHSATPTYAEMRYAMASALMDDGYFAANDNGYTNVQWFDEFDVDLGHAVDGPQLAPAQNGVYVRRFEKGMAIVNPKDNGPQTIMIEPGYQRFLGTQDPVANNGLAVSTITLGDRQGIILIKGPAGNHAPVANAGVDQTVDVSSNLTAAVVLDGRASSDADADPLTYSWTWSGGSATGPIANVTLPYGSTIVTLTVDDGKAGTSTDSVVINVADRTPPVITPPAAITVDATSATGSVVSFTASATDAISGPVAVTATPASGTLFPVGTTSVALSAADAVGNMATANFNVTVVAYAPVITLQPGSKTATAGESVTFSVVVTGTPPFGYAWRKDGAVIPGATSATLAFPTVTVADTGSYTVTLTNIAGAVASNPAVLTVNPAQAALTLSGLDYRYDGTPKSAVVTTVPAGLDYEITYDGSAAPPVNPGTYAVVATSTDPDYTGSVSGTLRIGITALVRHAPTLNGDVDGSVQVLLPESVSLNGGAGITGDLLMSGTPAVRLNGNPIFGGTRDGVGIATPANHVVTLNGGALLRYLVRRTNPIGLPIVSPPPASAGTRDVVLNSSGQSAGDFATLRDLTLNGNAGSVSVPPGTYRTFIANANSAVVLGVAGATEPAVYQLRGLTLNGGAQLRVVGPVVLTLADSLIANGDVGAPGHSEWLTLRISGGGLTLNGSITFHGTVIAPAGQVTINNGTIEGEVSSDRLVINGNGVLRDTP
jgi:MBG domain/Hypothetical glycosyl hydrolase family 15/Immunoglobulin domain/HYR domain